MSEQVSTAPKMKNIYTGDSIINDFQIRIGTINGTGSQTANLAIMRALFNMGVPINGKNMFPSNIQGLPTWFTIRLSKDGYIARRENQEIVVMLNQASLHDDHASVSSGGIVIYPEEWNFFNPNRDDVTYYTVPVKGLLKEFDIPSARKDYVANMVYVGALCAILDIPVAEIEKALMYQFGGREKPVQMNMPIVQKAFEWIIEHHEKNDAFSVEPMGETEDKFLLNGNAAAGMGTVFGGMNFIAWYPITPSTGVIDNARSYAQQLRHEEDGKATYAIIQSEDELAAIGMILGAGWAGARAMTSTSGPGIALMTEFVGMGYFAEIPVVIWDVQRMGPSTGLPTRTAQGDVLSTYFLGLGDTKQICLFPSNLEECFEFGWRSFDIAEQFQTIIFVMSDLDLGMNYWMSDRFTYPDQPMDRGKVLDAKALEAAGEFARYRDSDGDGIPYRTLPGTDHPLAGYFTRGTGHDEEARYSEDPDVWLANLERLAKKFDTARSKLPQPVVDEVAGAEVGFIAYGTTDSAIIEARDRLEQDGVKTSYLRIKSLPLSDTVREFIENHDRVYVAECNFDGQMASIITLDYPDLATKLRRITNASGLPFTARQIVEDLQAQEERAS